MTPATGPERFKIEQSRLLLVEGNDDVQFFRRIIAPRQGEGIQVIPFGGKDRLGAFLKDVLVPRVRATDIVRIIGVVRDADDVYDPAFQSVSDLLRLADLPSPDAPATPKSGLLDGDEIAVATYIMPDDASGGDLETLILRAIKGRPALDCVEQYIECLKAQGQTVQHERKAKLHAFLASDSGDPTLQPGQAIDAGVIPWNSPAFDDVHKFLDILEAAD